MSGHKALEEPFRASPSRLVTCRESELGPPVGAALLEEELWSMRVRKGLRTE